jgi:hypothetical protein|tara:strand:+ start:90 stop:335 length:246 start_codon:yes stop_codon:yes gene_type:complete
MKIKFKLIYECNEIVNRIFEYKGETWTCNQIKEGGYKGVWNLFHWENIEEQEFDPRYEPWVDGFCSIADCKNFIKRYYNNN